MDLDIFRGDHHVHVLATASLEPNQIPLAGARHLVGV
jgi:hypothetical protein